MTLYNCGTIYASSPFTPEAVSAIEDILDRENEDWFHIDGDMLEFEEFPSSSLEMKLDKLVDQLGEMGICLQGRIDYSGDFEGAYLWQYGKTHEEKTQAELAIMDAGDQELVDELRRRGFCVELWHEPAPEIRGMVMS